MKASFLVIFLSFFLFIQAIAAQSNFEGKITYEITYEPIHPNATVEFLEENQGVKEILYYRKGHYKRVFLNRNNDTVKTIVFNPKTKSIYGSHIWIKDTIMFYRSTKNIMASYTSKNVENISIVGHEAYGVECNFNYKEDETKGGPETSKITYYFSKNFPIKAKWHKNQKDGFYDEIIIDNPYLILKTINDDKWINIETKTAVEILPMKIDMSIFEIDESKPLLKI